ncbi:hypothetical protein [Saccharopolyspora sp. NPDC002376]
MLPVALPAPTFRLQSGVLDRNATEQYAVLVGSTWIRQVIIAGPMGFGERATQAERLQLLDLWADNVDRSGLVSACWNPEDTSAALRRGIRPLVMLRASTADELLTQMATLPRNAIAYANPRYSRVVLTAELAAKARRRGVMPTAVKLSKVTAAQIAQIRAEAGPELEIIHGSSRDITGSITAGANSVVAPPLASLPDPWPQPSGSDVQRCVDRIQLELDTRASHVERVEMITRLASSRLLGCG